MKFKLNRKTSDILVSLYIIITMAARIYLEPQLQGHYLVSVALGVFGLLFLWAIVKSGLLNPSFFGLWPGEKQEQSTAS